MSFQRISADDIIAELNSDFENLSTMSSPAPSSFSSISAMRNDGDVDLLPNPKVPSTTYTGMSDSLSIGVSIVTLFAFTDRGEKAEPLPPLKSFVPVIETLPGLLLEDNTYVSPHKILSVSFNSAVLTIRFQYVGSPLLCGDLKAFRSYARRVEDLVLTDVGHEEYPRVSQDTMTRLALIQDAKNPFLSSLRRLQLVDVDSELLYLWLCITPSLETLEVGGIPYTRQISISNFFEELVGSVPRLANITLGPGRLSAGVLQSSTRFVHLRQLRIIDAAALLNFAFLVAVAALPELELFDIDTRTAKYTPYTPPAAVSADALAKEKDAHGEGWPDAEDTTSEILEKAPFPRLKKLTIVSNVLLMCDLLRRLLPRGIEQVSLTLVRGGFLPIPAHWNLMPPESSEPTADVEILVESVVQIEHSADATSLAPPLTHPLLGSSEQVVDDSLIYTVPYHTFDSWGEMIVCPGDRAPNSHHMCPECTKKRRLEIKKAKKKKALTQAQHQQPKTKQQLEQEPPEEQKRLEEQQLDAQRRLEGQQRDAQLLLDAEGESVSNILPQIAHFASVIERILEHAKPQTIHITRVDASSSALTPQIALSPPDLPPATLRKLLSFPGLEKLDIKDWALTSVNEALLELSNPSELPLSMQILHLPIEESLNSGVALSTLTSVSQNYPRLLDFQTRVVHNVDAYNLEVSTTTHNLKELSLGGDAPSSVADKLTIAPYICFLFPHLECIVTHKGHDTEGWKSVHELVKMCQKVRDTHERSLRLRAQ